MKKFMDENFLLSTKTAEKLFAEYAKDTPVLDYHCHINPKEIAEDRHFDNITQVWLGGDHYKWRFMRSCGVEERYITGDASDKEKFMKWAQCLERAIGNPLYHWSHLELQRYFGFDGYLCSKNAEEVWELCNSKLAEPDMSARNIIKKSNVTLVCTTDDPIDDLHWHEMIAADESFDVKVLPAWRPDKACDIEKTTFTSYIDNLAKVSGIEINGIEDLKNALSARMDYFGERGCVVSDHGLSFVPHVILPEEELDKIWAKKKNGEELDFNEVWGYKTALLIFLGKEYAKRGWVLQLHYGVKRDNNKAMFDKIGPDTGFDSIGSSAPVDMLADYLNELEKDGLLPKTIIYSLNPNDNAAIGTIIGCFQQSCGIGMGAKIQQGSAWWFNDNKTGMTDQITSLANLGNLSGFVGMLTDSRSFLSYTRHEYFRRILCDTLGKWVENGEFPEDYDILGEIVKNISYYNVVNYFGFDL